MNQGMRTIGMVLSTCFGVATLQASVSTVFGPATGYNAFIFNNFTDSCCDVGGNLAVGGKTTVSNFAVGQSYYSGSSAGVTYSYVGVGALTGPLALDAGNAYYSGGGSPNIYFNGQGQTKTTSGGSGIDFAAAATSLTGYSNYLAGLPTTTTPTADPGGGFDISAQNTGSANIVNLTPAQLAGALHIQIATGATLLINVTGASASTASSGIFINGQQSYGDSALDAGKIVFNFTGTSFTANESLVGTVLAPNATFTGINNLQLDGELIAKNFTGNTEFHDDLFTGALPAEVATPEPHYSLMLGGAFLSVGLIRKLIRRP